MEKPTDSLSTCYNCGASGGSSSKLCPSCQQQGDERRRQLQQRLRVDTTGEQDPFVYRVVSLPVAWVGVAILLIAVLLGFAFEVGPRYGLAPVTTLLTATIVVVAALVVGSWIELWRALRRLNPGITVVGLVVPPVLYMDLFRSLRAPEPQAAQAHATQIRIIATAHALGMALLVLTLAVASMVGGR
jgi:hypothetical protein